MKKTEKTEAQDDIKEESQTEEKIETSNKSKKLIACVLGGVIALLAVAYISVAIFYSTRFFPGTVINGVNYSNLDKATVDVKMVLELQNYQLEVTGREVRTGESGSLLTVISAEDVELRIGSRKTDLEEILRRQNGWLWPAFLWSKDYTYTLTGDVNINEDKLKMLLTQQEAFQTQNMTMARNA